jgi:hypothetical protein
MISLISMKYPWVSSSSRKREYGTVPVASSTARRLGHAGTAITLDLYSHTTRGMQQDAAIKFDDIVLSSVKQ